MLGPVSSHTAAETRRGVASLGSQPTVAGHSGDHPPDLETLRATPARPRQILIQDNLCGCRWTRIQTPSAGAPRTEDGLSRSGESVIGGETATTSRSSPCRSPTKA